MQNSLSFPFGAVKVMALQCFCPVFQPKPMVRDICFAFDKVKEFRNWHPPEGICFALLQGDGIFVTRIGRKKTVIEGLIGIFPSVVKRDERTGRNAGLLQKLSAGGCFGIFTGQCGTACGGMPQAGKNILLQGALHQQNVTVGVLHNDLRYKMIPSLRDRPVTDQCFAGSVSAAVICIPEFHSVLFRGFQNRTAV